jgi:hypothetical protein
VYISNKCRKWIHSSKQTIFEFAFIYFYTFLIITAHKARPTITLKCVSKGELKKLNTVFTGSLINCIQETMLKCLMFLPNYNTLTLSNFVNFGKFVYFKNYFVSRRISALTFSFWVLGQIVINPDTSKYLYGNSNYCDFIDFNGQFTYWVNWAFRYKQTVHNVT